MSNTNSMNNSKFSEEQAMANLGDLEGVGRLEGYRTLKGRSPMRPQALRQPLVVIPRRNHQLLLLQTTHEPYGLRQ
jgi:hypothetical protein